jgi:hypothetical protein
VPHVLREIRDDVGRQPHAAETPFDRLATRRLESGERDAITVRAAHRDQEVRGVELLERRERRVVVETGANCLEPALDGHRHGRPRRTRFVPP